MENTNGTETEGEEVVLDKAKGKQRRSMLRGIPGGKGGGVLRSPAPGFKIPGATSNHWVSQCLIYG